MDNKEKIIVVGDVILDIYSHCLPIGLSAETPTISVKHIKDELTLGGAGLVYQNLKSLHSNVSLITASGKKDTHIFNDNNVILIEDDKFSLTKKKRYWADNHKLLQVLDETSYDISSNTQQRLINKLLSIIDDNTKLVFCDYRTGFFTKDFCEALFDSIEHINLCFIDSQCHRHEPRYEWFKGCIPIMNNQEAEKYFHIKLDSNNDIHHLLEKINNTYPLIIKNGRHGVIGINNGTIFSEEGLNVNAIDTCGAGDAFLASFVYNFNGDNFHASLKFANEWAACSTTLLGTLPVTKEYFKEKQKWNMA